MTNSDPTMRKRAPKIESFERVLVLRWNVCGIGLPDENDTPRCSAAGEMLGRSSRRGFSPAPRGRGYARARRNGREGYVSGGNEVKERRKRKLGAEPDSLRRGGGRGVYYVPNRRSPKSPRPGTMYLRSLSARSRAAVKITASGATAARWATPSGAATIDSSRTSRAPRPTRP